LEAHVLSHFIKTPEHHNPPSFPFLCLLVSGGHTQILCVKSPCDFEMIGTTIDDAAGETIDKAAKIMGLPYPGGPVIDRFSKQGNDHAFTFAHPHVAELNYSFSGLKTSFLYFVRDQLKKNDHFIEENTNDLCACIQKSVIDTLMEKLIKASQQTNIKQIAIAGGVSANSLLRKNIEDGANKYGWTVFIPPLSFTTDNAAMVAMAAYFKYQKSIFCDLSVVPFTRGDSGKC
ncbi:MAG: tRNA (adenosine(37)-N6)-threonylcarbamoyltransferase complex transferase subunit TsaD, partial [Bacteroidales bacterium]